MLPGAAHGMHGGNIPPGSFSGDTALMAMEDSYWTCGTATTSSITAHEACSTLR